MIRSRLRRLVPALVFGFLIASSTAASAVTRWVNDDDPNGGGYAPPGTSCTDPGYQPTFA